MGRHADAEQASQAPYLRYDFSGALTSLPSTLAELMGARKLSCTRALAATATPLGCRRGSADGVAVS